MDIHVPHIPTAQRSPLRNARGGAHLNSRHILSGAEVDDTSASGGGGWRGRLVKELLKPEYREGCFILLAGDRDHGNWELISLVKRSSTEVYRFRLIRNNETKESS